MRNLVTYQTSLSGNIVLLCRFLRQKGFNVSTSEEADALRALALLPIGSEGYFKAGLRAILAKNRFQQQHFDEYYEEFWQQLRQARDAKVKEVPTEKPKRQSVREQQARFDSLKSWLNLMPAEEEKEVATYSDLHVLSRKHFADLSQEEMRLMTRVLRQVARRLAHRPSRLKKRSHRHKTPDIKRTVKAAMRQKGEIRQLLFSEKKQRKLKLVLLCDVSKSMELYSRFFVHLIYAFQNSYDKIDTFVFSTALHQVSDLLNNYEFEKAFAMIADRVPNWSGGTTIGTCLDSFYQRYGYSRLDKKTVVMILSDGWDTGQPEVVKQAMRAIYKKARKVIWLNPLAGNPGFSPAAIGLQAALPYIDLLAPAHNLESLRQALLQIGTRRKSTPRYR